MELGVSYFGNRIPRHYREQDLPEIVACGCSYVVHTFSENDLQFYQGAMEEIVALTHRAGLKVYLDPWGVGGIFGGEAFSSFLLQNLDVWQVKADGTPVPMACARAPKFQAFMRRWVDTAIGLGADVIFWDEPHLYLPGGASVGPGDLTCWCQVCRDQYRQRYGEPMPRALTAQVSEFRQDTITAFLEAMCDHVRSGGARNAVCLLAFDDPAHGVVDWDRVAEIRGLDILGVTPFWALQGRGPGEFVGHWARKVAEVCQSHGKEPQVWLQGFRIGAGREAEIAEAAEVAVDSGVRNLAVWGFEGCGHMSAIRPDHPEEVWRVVRKVFTRLRDS